MDSALLSLLGAFLLSMLGLFAFIWSLRKGLLVENVKAASAIFARGEIGRVDDPALESAARADLQAAAVEAGDAAHVPDEHDMDERVAADRSSAFPVFMFIGFACMWLLFGGIAGLTASLKLHWPDWLVSEAWMTFGRIRTVHLTAVLYGWITNAELGIIIWLMPRLLRTPLMGSMWIMMGGALVNIAIASGIGAIGVGWTDGLEYLEMPWQIGIFFAAGMVCIIGPVMYTLVNRKVESLYVTTWYHTAGLLWITLLFIVGKMPGVHFGVQQAAMNWWYGHNVLGLFYTPLALASIYYFLPKIIGRPIQSYNLSLLGFWALAFFYGQVGGHHLVGGPVPEWMITLSIVQSMMMIIPVAAFTVNQYQTLQGHLSALRWSPTLRFIGIGGLMYTASSVQGSLEALRSMNAVTHFTHYTVAHAHLGLYGFVSMVFFGAMYFVMPRITAREWPYPSWILIHFWLVTGGFAFYFVTLTMGGWLQGLAMLDEARSFMDSVTLTLPYLKARSIGGALMVTGHLVFALHFVALALGWGPNRERPALFKTLFRVEAA